MTKSNESSIVGLVSLNDFLSTWEPTRAQRLNAAMDRLDDFCEDKGISFESEELLNMMDKLASGLSCVLDSPIAQWSILQELDITLDLSCQCNRTIRREDYDIIVWKYFTDKDGDLSRKPYYHVLGWTERLPEKH